MPTTFQNMRDSVISLTKRPELVSVTDMAIRMATIRAHHTDFFPRDQANLVLPVFTIPQGNTLFVDFATIFTTVARLRTPDFLQGEDITTLNPVENLEFVADFKNFWDESATSQQWQIPTDGRDVFGLTPNTLRNSVFTLMGDTLRARFMQPTGRARLFYYTNPDTAIATYASWIADTYPDELAKWAAGIVWARSGFTEQAQLTQRDDVMPFKELLVASHLSSKV